jgi:hypothetical protein
MQLCKTAELRHNLLGAPSISKKSLEHAPGHASTNRVANAGLNGRFGSF